MKTDEEIGLGSAATIQQQQEQINKPPSRTLASILSKKSSFVRPTTPSVIITDETTAASSPPPPPLLLQQQPYASSSSSSELPPISLDVVSVNNGVPPSMMDCIVMDRGPRTDDGQRSPSNNPPGESSPNSRINSATSAMSRAATAIPTVEEDSSKLAVLRRRCCSETVRSVIWGLLIMSSVSLAMLGSNHMLKSTFQTVHYYNRSTITNNTSSPEQQQHPIMSSPTSSIKNRGSVSDNLYRLTFQDIDNNDNDDNDDNESSTGEGYSRYKSTFLNTWTVSTWNLLYLPLYVLGCFITGRPGPRKQLVTDLRESLLAFRDKGFTRGTFMGRCCLLCLLWVGTNWMYMYALSVLDATDVMALFATNLSFVYLLSWVVLHIQFVGLRIVAVIFCNTGIALLAYMDGIAGRSPTLGGVVLAAAASAGSAVYKVSFKKIFGDATYGQVSFFCSLIGLFNLVLLWPLLLTLHFSGAETVDWARIPWAQLAAAGSLSLVTNLLSNFGPGLTYETYIHLGVVAAIPISAVLDMEYNGAVFEGMKLAGTVMIVSGFLLVLLPSNWTDYIARFLTWGRNWNHNSQQVMATPAVDLRTGYISRSHLRTPSGRVK